MQKKCAALVRLRPQPGPAPRPHAQECEHWEHSPNRRPETFSLGSGRPGRARCRARSPIIVETQQDNSKDPRHQEAFVGVTFV
jgi:hypothetical protein